MARGIQRSGPKMAFTPMNLRGATPDYGEDHMVEPQRLAYNTSLVPPKRACQVA